MGVLRTFAIKAIQNSQENRDGNRVKFNFVAILKCNSCNEIVSVLGIVEKNCSIEEEDPLGNLHYDYKDFYYPKFFYPNLRIFKLDSKIPESIKNQIDLSFSSFFNDFSSSANSARIALELIIDIKTESKFKNIRTLHDRIEESIKQKIINEETGKLLMAMKWVGNDGSHNFGLAQSDLIDMFRILELVLDELFVNKNSQILLIADKINFHKISPSKIKK